MRFFTFLKNRYILYYLFLLCYFFARFYTITATCYRRAMGIMVVYDVTDEKSYTSVTKWMTKITEHADKNVDKILVANKCDLQDKRKVTRVRGESLADTLGISYVEMSALSNSHIDEAFTTLAKDILNRVLSCGENGSAELQPEKREWDKNCTFC